MSPMAQYRNFASCIAKNKSKRNPQAYCATIMRAVEGKSKQSYSKETVERARRSLTKK